MVLGAGLASYEVSAAHSYSQVLVATQNIARGQVITAADLGVANLAGNNFTGVGVGYESQVVGRIAGAYIPAGSLLGKGDLAHTAANPNDRVIGIGLSSGSYPAAGLNPGDYVDIVYAPTGGGATSLNGISPGQVVAAGVTVIDVGLPVTNSGSSSAIIVSVQVPAAEEGVVAAIAGAHAASLILSHPGAAIPAYNTKVAGSTNAAAGNASSSSAQTTAG